MMMLMMFLFPISNFFFLPGFGGPFTVKLIARAPLLFFWDNKCHFARGSRQEGRQLWFAFAFSTVFIFHVMFMFMDFLLFLYKSWPLL